MFAWLKNLVRAAVAAGIEEGVAEGLGRLRGEAPPELPALEDRRDEEAAGNGRRKGVRP
jgi:hypothetical protein